MGPWLSWKVHLTEREKQKLQVWARVMPFREPLAWATVALFDANITGGVGGFSSSPSSPLPPGLLGSALMEASLDSDGRLIADAKAECASVPVLVDVPSLHRIKENYTEEMLQVSYCDLSSDGLVCILCWGLFVIPWLFHFLSNFFAEYFLNCLHLT